MAPAPPGEPGHANGLVIVRPYRADIRLIVSGRAEPTRWEIHCPACDDDRPDEESLPPEIRALRGPYPSQETAWEAAEQHMGMTRRDRPPEDESVWMQVGWVIVDSGTCLVVDPTYHRDGLYGVDEVAAVMTACADSSSQSAALLGSDGDPIGTVVQTGYGGGGGGYPVEARYIIDKRGAARIAEIRITFITDL